MINDFEELDLAISEVIALCGELSEFDLAELNAGRITVAGARFEAAFANLMAIGGVSDMLQLEEDDEAAPERHQRPPPVARRGG